MSCPNWCSDDPESVPPEKYRMSYADPLIQKIPADCMVGKWEVENIDHRLQENLHHENQNNFWRMVRHFKSSVFGLTWRATVIWMAVFLIGEGISLKVKDCTNSTLTEIENRNNESWVPCTMLLQMKGAKGTKEFTNFGKNMKIVLYFFLGFYVKTVMTRWWTQTSKIPRLTDLALVCTAIFQPGEKDGAEKSCKTKIRDVLRFCGLSYSIVMLSISSRQKGAKTTDQIIQLLLDKELATEEELKKLGFRQPNLKKDYFTSCGGAMQVWYLPIVWASLLVSKEQPPNKDGYLQKEGKDIAKNLGKFKYDLEHVAEYSQRPLPAIMLQALGFLFWATLVFGTLDNSYTFVDQRWYYMPLDFFLHFDELIVYILLYAWLTMAKISTNPFDGDKHFDIDVIERIDAELFEATMAIHI